MGGRDGCGAPLHLAAASGGAGAKPLPGRSPGASGSLQRLGNRRAAAADWLAECEGWGLWAGSRTLGKVRAGAAWGGPGMGWAEMSSCAARSG